jgi:hypothetical protein
MFVIGVASLFTAIGTHFAMNTSRIGIQPFRLRILDSLLLGGLVDITTKNTLLLYLSLDCCCNIQMQFSRRFACTNMRGTFGPFASLISSCFFIGKKHKAFAKQHTAKKYPLSLFYTRAQGGESFSYRRNLHQDRVLPCYKIR